MKSFPAKAQRSKEVCLILLCIFAPLREIFLAVLHLALDKLSIQRCFEASGRVWSPVNTQMARRRFRSNQRHEPTTERSFQEYILSTPGPQTSRTELLRLIRGCEDTFLELKVKLSNTEKIAQEIVALANTGGGVIVFGVNDQMRVEGLDDPERVQDDLLR